MYADWGPHCQAMHADWEQLMSAYSGTTDSLIASAKCQDSSHADAAGRPLCDLYKTTSIPHLMYGTADNMQPYSGGRDYSSLLSFAQTNIGEPSSHVSRREMSQPSTGTCDMEGSVV